ncbi:uncharacterized protein LOC121376532 [Gigantopelta aegis]|uniref:uncharacterized protein LOC121376532 n=1 Tax=Gigantopelta aegis TaxID=1735272 RepID=UPI001B888A81|nr:uncharacterized protein LOC121376532 [Gigantopelta aegis]
MFPLAKEVAEKLTYDVKKNKTLMMSVFKRLTLLLEDDSFPWFDRCLEAFSLGTTLVSALIDGIKDSKILSMEDLDVLVEITRIVMEKDFYDPNTGMTNSIFYITYISLGTNLLRWLDTLNEVGRASSLIPGIVNLASHDDDDISGIAGTQLQMISQKSGKYLALHLDGLIQNFLDKEKFQFIAAIDGAYVYNPKALTPHFKQIFSFIDSGNPGVKTYICFLLQKVAKKQPELFTEEIVSEIMKEAGEDRQSQIVLLQILESVAQKYPDRLAPHLPTLINFDQFEEYAKSVLVGILKNIGYASQKHCGIILNHFSKILRSSNDQMTGMLIIDGMKTVGSKHKPELEKHRQTLEDVKKQSTVQSVKDGCQHMIDYLEGRSLEGLSIDIQQQQEELDVLDTKVTETKEEVKVVKKDVRRQGEEIQVVKQDVREQGEKIEEIDETVQETVVKVEEIDSKTLSHAPFWSRDVSKLLNPKDEHDWRLLSSRLGYSNDDIRAWAQQADPCMAMLNEWYTMHKTSEASLAVLKHLQEMDRMDAAIIVENAMKMAETVVEDEEFEYVSPPQIFLSYQWGYQNEVKVLAKHLEMAGYDCWLDIGQMGGGDKLFEKIDKGIRGAKVVISCVTEKYAKSPNCNREVNLAVNLGKSMIPLLMERVSWPPPGSMGPIFSEYLYIRFYTRGDAGPTDDRYWDPEKFQELLMQLSFNNLERNEKTIAPQYKNWWLPVEEAVVVDKKRNKEGTNTVAVVETQDDGVSPDVFISYQWGKQKQVIKLYQRLQQMGFSCWMDIHQMGGGDSLYDKIDRGVRGCKVVVSCVTTKYALSANCRREVSLADALKKPLVPLLLESITWPPSGPMSMAFTQLLYIDFSRDDTVQNRWTGPEFDQLVTKIQEIIPPQTKSSVQSSSSKSQPSQNTEKNKSGAVPKSTGDQKSSSKSSGQASSKSQQQPSQNTEEPKRGMMPKTNKGVEDTKSSSKSSEQTSSKLQPSQNAENSKSGEVPKTNKSTGDAKSSSKLIEQASSKSQSSQDTEKPKSEVATSKFTTPQKDKSTAGPRPPPSQAGKQTSYPNTTKTKKEVLKSANEKLQQPSTKDKQLKEQPKSSKQTKPSVKSAKDDASGVQQKTNSPSEESKSKSCLIL